MSTSTDYPKQIHQGRNVKRFREMLGLKQEALAAALGGEWTQKRVSLLEAREVIDPVSLVEIANALNIPEDAIKNLDDESALNIISNTFTSHDNSTSIAYQSTLTFNPIEKLVEVYEENKKLYEQLLASEREKVEILRGK